MTKRRCKAKTKAGKPCQAWALHGHMVCLAHADADTRASVGFVPEAGKAGGRPRKVKPMEIEKRLMERYAIAWMKPYWRILGFDVGLDADGELYLTELPEGGAKLYGESKEGFIHVSDADDLGAQMAAAEKLRDRVFGRPTSKSEFSGEVTHRNAERLDQAIERELQRLSERLAERDGDRSPTG